MGWGSWLDVRFRRPRVVEAESPEVTFEWLGNTLRHAGVVVHRLIERIAREGLERWDERRVLDCAGEIRAALLSLGVSPSEVAGVTRRVTDAIR